MVSTVRATKPLTLVTEAIHENEPCLELTEMNRVTLKAGAGIRRIQTVKVVRDDQVWTWEWDMGPAAKFKTEPFIFPGAVTLASGHVEVLETVGRLRGAANEFRAKYDKPYQTRTEPTDFKKAFEEQASRRRDARHGNPVRFAMNAGGR